MCHPDSWNAGSNGNTTLMFHTRDGDHGYTDLFIKLDLVWQIVQRIIIDDQDDLDPLFAGIAAQVRKQ